MCPLVSQLPFTDPLNWNLYATHWGETHIPFHDYVRPKQTCQLEVPFAQFTQLPRELQLRILRFCNSATLFQLMHVSSATRDEARKLFWANPGSRYVIRGRWLLAGGFSGDTLDDVGALAFIKHVEVDFDAEGLPLYNIWDDDTPQWARRLTADVAERLADAFWQTFTGHLPCATNVILKKFQITGDTDAGEVAPAGLIVLAERCPVGIHASASCIETLIKSRAR